jgi:hypothetical protein
MLKWMLPNIMSIPPCKLENAERDTLACGLNSKDPKWIDPSAIGDDEANGDGDDGEGVTDVIGISDEVP